MPTVIISLIAIACVAYAILQVITSAETVANKTVWTLLILLLPLIGFIIWVIAGPRTQRTSN